MRLTDLRVGKSGIIDSVDTEGFAKRRLLDLGFVPGTRVTNLRKSPAGNPIAFLVRDTVIALRCEETDQVQIKEN